MNPLLQVHPEIHEALATSKPVVALESTIISHGMPYPTNVETAREVQQIVRDNGAVPATIAIIDGHICIGLSDEQLERIASDNHVYKVSRRDLPVVVATGATGATTVSATMICADLAGIYVFVTGGIGGVHREGHNSMDISADLMELANTPVAVVCAGAKAILDLPRTLQMLETHGVPVIGYQSDEFPAFYSRSSGLSVDVRLDSADEVAWVMHAKWQLGLRGGLLITVPVPIADEIPRRTVDKLIDQALQEAEQKQISGTNITPFLLASIAEKSSGQSLKTNIALVKNNARIGAWIASSFTKIALHQAASG